ncbi:MAG TPA: hypothetical protein VIK42_00755 [Bacteroidales bacterium]
MLILKDCMNEPLILADILLMMLGEGTICCELMTEKRLYEMEISP